MTQERQEDSERKTGQEKYKPKIMKEEGEGEIRSERVRDRQPDKEKERMRPPLLSGQRVQTEMANRG